MSGDAARRSACATGIWRLNEFKGRGYSVGIFLCLVVGRDRARELDDLLKILPPQALHREGESARGTKPGNTGGANRRNSARLRCPALKSGSSSTPSHHSGSLVRGAAKDSRTV